MAGRQLPSGETRCWQPGSLREEAAASDHLATAWDAGASSFLDRDSFSAELKVQQGRPPGVPAQRGVFSFHGVAMAQRRSPGDLTGFQPPSPFSAKPAPCAERLRSNCATAGSNCILLCPGAYLRTICSQPAVPMTLGSAPFLPNSAFYFRMSKPWRSCSQLPAEILKTQFQHKKSCSFGTLAMIASGYLWSRLKPEKTIFSFSPNDFHIPILRLQEIWGSIRAVRAGPTDVSWDQLLKPAFPPALLHSASPASDSVPISILFPLLFLLL